jgi:RNA polymerase sigma-70 factor (ECF subfamily)
MTSRARDSLRSFRADPGTTPGAWDWAAVRAFCLAVALRYTDTPEEAEDAAQEAAERAWRYRASCRAPDPRAWIAAIARREALRISTAGRARVEIHLDDVPDPGRECDRLATADDRAAVRAALAALRPAERRLLWLRYGRDLTQPAIANALGVPEGTVKIRLHRARARLRSAM